LKTNFQKMGKRFELIKSFEFQLPQDMSLFDPLSMNKVTGASINFPVSETCQPSKVCANTCYALRGPLIWSASLKKQQLNMLTCQSSPADFAAAVINKCSKKIKRDSQFFLRWNGTGDLFDEAVEALLLINQALPNMPIWVVTRKPQHVERLANIRNIWVHFSLDRASMSRRKKVLSLFKVQPKNLFFSYQADKNEVLEAIPADISVVFFDSYKIKGNEVFNDHPALCPLNSREDISSTCRACRRCFNGTAQDINYA
jgi:hypothetical protein